MPVSQVAIVCSEMAPVEQNPAAAAPRERPGEERDHEEEDDRG